MARLPAEMMRAAALAALLLAACSQLPAQDTPVFKAGVSLIRVDTEVVTSSGLTLTGLHNEDFRVFDEGVEQPITAFSFEEEPLDLILLFDLSGGMKGKLLQVVRAVELGFHELKKGDRVCVMAYRRDLQEVAPFTADLDAVNRTILLKALDLQFGGTSSLEQASSGAAVIFRTEPPHGRRRAILVVTDKVSGTSQSSVRELWKSDAVLSELVLGKMPETSVPDRGTSLTADRTGGATVLAGPPGPSFQLAIRLLRRRYSIYFQAPGGQSGAERKIEVRLSPAAATNSPGAKVRSRTGYLLP
jgi:hypothetical protein